MLREPRLHARQLVEQASVDDIGWTEAMVARPRFDELAATGYNGFAPLSELRVDEPPLGRLPDLAGFEAAHANHLSGGIKGTG